MWATHVSLSVIAIGLLSGISSAFEVPIAHSDSLREICSGMYADRSTYINVSFTGESAGRLAMIIYEFSDVRYIGKPTDPDPNALWPELTYVCTTDAVAHNICDSSDLGKFIIDLPAGVSLNQTSIWSGSIGFSSNSSSGNSSSTGFWNNPDGNIPPPGGNENGTIAWRRSETHSERQLSSVPTVLYTQPIQYMVTKKGYYCVGTVPITVIEGDDSTPPTHAAFKGTILFKNTFGGKLPAADYPKVNFYFLMTLITIIVAGGWGFLCWKHREDLLPIQNYISALMGLLAIEMLANWAYYRYLNAHGKGVSSTAFLFVVAILDAGRNALSFFLLLVVSLGLSVVREELTFMLRCKILAIAHFIFGVLYAIGVVEIELETVTILMLLFFVIPLAFTLSAFLLWIMYGLQGTMAELAARKQTYKLSMFRKLHAILIVAVLIIGVFFVVSSMSFSSRYEEDFASNSWSYRWWLMDGYLVILYLGVFSGIAFLWRPTGNNRRLAMSHELAQNEEDAEDYDLEALQAREPASFPRADDEEGRIQLANDDDDDDGTSGNHHSGGGNVNGGVGVGRHDVGGNAVVFEIGDEDDEEEVIKPGQGGGERRGLIPAGGPGRASTPPSVRRVKDRMD